MADQPDPLATVRAALDLAAKAASPPWWVNEHHDGWCEIDAKHLVDTATLHNAAAIVALRNAAPALIHGHGPRCPCDHCAWQMRHATAACRLARGLRALAWIEPIRTEPRRN